MTEKLECVTDCGFGYWIKNGKCELCLGNDDAWLDIDKGC